LRLDSRKPRPKGVAQAIDFQPQATSQPITQASPHNPPTQFPGHSFPAQPSRKENKPQKQIKPKLKRAPHQYMHMHKSKAESKPKQIRLQMQKTKTEISQTAQKVI